MVVRYLKSIVNRIMRDVEHDIVHAIEWKLNRFYRSFMRFAFASACLLLSGLMLLLAILFFLMDYIHINRTLSFLVVGIIMLLIGIIMRIK